LSFFALDSVDDRGRYKCAAAEKVLKRLLSRENQINASDALFVGL